LVYNKNILALNVKNKILTIDMALGVPNFIKTKIPPKVMDVKGFG
jgi:hypothetical protein